MSGQFPRDLNLVTVQFGPFVDSIGNPMEGLTVRIETSNNIIHSSGAAVLASQRISLRTDSYGIATVDLVATDSDNVKNPGFTYKVTLDSRITRNNEVVMSLPKDIQSPANFSQLYHHFHVDGQVYSYGKEALVRDVVAKVVEQIGSIGGGEDGVTLEDVERIVAEKLSQASGEGIPEVEGLTRKDFADLDFLLAVDYLYSQVRKSNPEAPSLSRLVDLASYLEDWVAQPEEAKYAQVESYLGLQRYQMVDEDTGLMIWKWGQDPVQAYKQALAGVKDRLNPLLDQLVELGFYPEMVPAFSKTYSADTPLLSHYAYNNESTSYTQRRGDVASEWGERDYDEYTPFVGSNPTDVIEGVDFSQGSVSFILDLASSAVPDPFNVSLRLLSTNLSADYSWQYESPYIDLNGLFFYGKPTNLAGAVTPEGRVEFVISLDGTNLVCNAYRLSDGELVGAGMFPKSSKAGGGVNVAEETTKFRLRFHGRLLSAQFVDRSGNTFF